MNMVDAKSVNYIIGKGVGRWGHGFTTFCLLIMECMRNTLAPPPSSSREFLVYSQ